MKRAPIGKGIRKHEKLVLRSDMKNFPPKKSKVSHKVGY